MNKPQRVVLTLGFLASTAACLFPTWYSDFSTPAYSTRITTRSFLLTPPFRDPADEHPRFIALPVGMRVSLLLDVDPGSPIGCRTMDRLRGSETVKLALEELYQDIARGELLPNGSIRVWSPDREA